MRTSRHVLHRFITGLQGILEGWGWELKPGLVDGGRRAISSRGEAHI